MLLLEVTIDINSSWKKRTDRIRTCLSDDKVKSRYQTQDTIQNQVEIRKEMRLLYESYQVLPGSM